MQDADREVFEAAARWVAAGSSAWLYTVVRTWGSSPRPLGSMLALREDGRMAGSVSGGCIEDDLADRLLSQGPPSMRLSTVEYGLSADEAHGFDLPCGGTMRLACETLGAQRTRFAARRAGRRATDAAHARHAQWRGDVGTCSYAYGSRRIQLRRRAPRDGAWSGLAPAADWRRAIERVRGVAM
ncbi:XdhC family protein [Paraburkholderia heleia]|uniref:XdhC family protein n=1 Tax=Paraburkholderia heleia TaxID=634127 RepID=UPI001FE23C0A|nr:XdhC family protein [Paraburkholderia heleia]